MTGTQVLGAAMIALPFVPLFWMIKKDLGLKAILAIVGAVGVVVALIVWGALLLTGGELT